MSLMLATMNGLPYVREAIDSVRAQTYRDFELIVQDGASTDGTAEFLRGIGDLPHIDVVSAPDAGLGDAYNRAIARCRGAIVGTIDSDNLLEPDALARAIELFENNPDAAASYGAVRFVDESAKPLSVFVPAEFDLARVLRCEVVPPFSTSFFHRERCGDDLRWSTAYGTCHDFDLWLRLSQKTIVRVEHILGSTRLSPKSLTCNAANYDRFCTEKIAAIDSFLPEAATAPAAAQERNEAVAGVYAWAAESVYALEGRSLRFRRYVSLAEASDDSSPRVEALRRLRSRRIVIRPHGYGRWVYTARTTARTQIRRSVSTARTHIGQVVAFLRLGALRRSTTRGVKRIGHAPQTLAPMATAARAVGLRSTYRARTHIGHVVAFLRLGAARRSIRRRIRSIPQER